ncbi:putative estradiol 17 beta-dehydrogenase [Hypoxylon sp. FL1857]|nr:putative estradiol 17 beta-dehydrogenase [Hypoxylon sp. FL1857]
MAPNKNFSWTQFFPPKPQFTEQSIPNSLSGKVYVVTGANSGMGKELARVLYSRDAKVYAACRSEEKGAQAIAEIKKAEPTSKGELIFLHLDLADLAKVQAAAKAFLALESKLHVLFNNAGVMVGPSKPPPKTAQGYELALGVNCVGTFLWTKLLTPALVAGAKSEPADTVRVVWLSSFGLEQFAPEGRGVDLDNLDYHIPKSHIDRYGISKAGTWLLGAEFGRRHKADGIVSVPINPGNVRTELARSQGAALKIIAGAIVYPVINGVYTQLFAAFSPEVTNTKVDWTKKWVIPWGRVAPLRADLGEAVAPLDEGGNGNAQQFWEWNEQQVKNYLG